MRIFTISTLMPLLFYFPHRFTRPDQKTFKRYNPQNRSVTHESRHATVAWNGADSATRFLPMLKFFTPTTKQHTLAVSSTRVCCWCQLEKKWTSSKLFTAIDKQTVVVYVVVVVIGLLYFCALFICLDVNELADWVSAFVNGNEWGIKVQFLFKL